jgi:hypothetical protein
LIFQIITGIIKPIKKQPKTLIISDCVAIVKSTLKPCIKKITDNRIKVILNIIFMFLFPFLVYEISGYI